MANLSGGAHKPEFRPETQKLFLNRNFRKKNVCIPRYIGHFSIYLAKYAGLWLNSAQQVIAPQQIISAKGRYY